MTFESEHLCLEQHLDVRQSRDSVDQILRHARLEAPASCEQPDLGNYAREIHRRLACRVAGADERYLLPSAQLHSRGEAQ